MATKTTFQTYHILTTLPNFNRSRVVTTISKQFKEIHRFIVLSDATGRSCCRQSLLRFPNYVVFAQLLTAVPSLMKCADNVHPHPCSSSSLQLCLSCKMLSEGLSQMPLKAKQGTFIMMT